MPERKLFTKNLKGRSREAPASARWHCQQESVTEKRARALDIANVLGRSYEKVEVPLSFETTFQLLVAVILSAQCTDAAVNKVTPELFRHYPTAPRLAEGSADEIGRIIRPLGLFRAKARSIKTCARQLIERFNGEVPATLKELTSLAGVGRKTANVILGHAFDSPGIIVDTHCKRLAGRLGLTHSDDPAHIERDLNKLLPAAHWTTFSHRLILHGRRICHARKPNCPACVLHRLCPSRQDPMIG